MMSVRIYYVTEEGSTPKADMVLLGALVWVTDTCAKADARGDRIAKLKGRMAQAFELDYLTPEAASKLRCKVCNPPPPPPTPAHRGGTRPRDVILAGTPTVLPSHIETIG